MTENPAWSRMILREKLFRKGMLLVCFAAFVLSGCSMRKRPNIPWATAIQVRPEVLPRTVAANSIADTPAPELRIELPPIATILIPIRSGPAKPHVSTPPSVSAGADTEKLEAPMIAPQLSPQETAAAKQETNQSLSIAEKNLARMSGKTLNAAQADLVSKIKGFQKDAREAAEVGDWSHARGLAKKAQVLSEELASSL